MRGKGSRRAIPAPESILPKTARPRGSGQITNAIPLHLIGRGVTLLNLFGIAGAGIAQVLTGQLHHALSPAPYPAIFIYFGATTALGLAAYLLSRDRTD